MTTPTYLFLLLLAAVFGVAIFLTYVLIHHARRFKLVDTPNERSSHERPTPTGGGLAMLIALIIGLVVAYYQNWLSLDVIHLCCVSFLLAFVGMLDDWFALSMKLRLAIQILCACLAMFYFGYITTLPFGMVSIEIGKWGIVLSILIFVWITNLYNFMDGIDGITGIETLCLAGFAAIAFWHVGDSAFSHFFLLLICAVSGFLIWNWHPAKIFLGDVGSIFLGSAFGSIAIFLPSHHPHLALPFFIAFGAYFTDATLTAAKRFWRGLATDAPLYGAHKDHVYQRLMRYYKHNPRPVCYWLLAVNVSWLIPLAVAAYLYPAHVIAITSIAFVPVCIVMCYVSYLISIHTSNE